MAVRKLVEEDVPTPEAVARVLEEAGIDFVFGMRGAGRSRSTTPSTTTGTG